MTATKSKNDVNADQAFAKSMESYKESIGSYGIFTTDELQTMRQFFDLNTEAQALGRKADSIRADIETFESQITAARRQYAGLIQEGHTAKAMAAVEAIPDLRKRQETLRSKLPGISAQLDELEAALAEIDHSRFLNEAREAATAAEQSRCRAVSIFGRPGDVRKTISDARSKAKP